MMLVRFLRKKTAGVCYVLACAASEKLLRRALGDSSASKTGSFHTRSPYCLIMSNSVLDTG